MPKSRDQKLKLLYLKQILEYHTDIDHGITRKDIEKYLEQKGIKVDRKTVYLILFIFFLFFHSGSRPRHLKRAALFLPIRKNPASITEAGFILSRQTIVSMFSSAFSHFLKNPQVFNRIQIPENLLRNMIW